MNHLMKLINIYDFNKTRFIININIWTSGDPSEGIGMVWMSDTSPRGSPRLHCCAPVPHELSSIAHQGVLKYKRLS
jgi:hypothetical protein